MFKRRKPRSYGQIASEMIYPRGGWRRAGTYVMHRLRRLPDRPHRIGRGVAAGVFVSFTPLFGFHFLSAAAVAWIIRGNILAALLATFVGNPVTLPFIALASVGFGREILGLPGRMPPHFIFREFSQATTEIWHNINAIFGPEVAHWHRLADFFVQIFWPYVVGGSIMGLGVSVATHYMTVPIFIAYQKRREKRMALRIAKFTESSARRRSKGDQ
ncbi:DUF2062 domain-containing protein [Paracoccus sp. 1_MG-2023]|uniref:DUF2062 domain-containing protein n=1 Tax=unclassified Paracoccus (in: a-proteobacteria) TaxID=2688777 RepID=UPI0026E161F4|nr:DUF2062 domain-containing protein [Paracoccus sp. 1_MG-2023]MDO6669713.1 DUF2062 domain-containing protein [Paracoccus sp. 1_MG-2023]